MRKLLRLLPLLLIPLLFTSCIDYVQSITYKDGKYQMYYKVTLSKVLFALGDEDPEEIFESFDEDALEDLPENVPHRNRHICGCIPSGIPQNPPDSNG